MSSGPLAPSSLPTPSVETVLLSPFRLQTYRNLVYLLLAFPLGVLYFTFLVTGVSLGVGLAVLVVGVPMLLVVLACCHVGAGFERLTARYLLGVEISSPRYPFVDTDDPMDGLRALVFGSQTWKSMGYLLSKFAIGIGSFVLVTTLLSVGGALLTTPLYYDEPGVSVGLQLSEPIVLSPSIRIPWEELLIGIEFGLAIASWEVTTLPEAVATAGLGVLVLVGAFNVFNVLAWTVGRFTRLLLGRSGRSVYTRS